MADDAPDMAWVRFTADHDHRTALANQTTAYLKGMRCRVTRICAEVAKGLGRAEEIDAPDRATAERLAKDPFAKDLPPAAPPAGAAQPVAAAPAPQEPPKQPPATDAPAASPGLHAPNP